MQPFGGSMPPASRWKIGWPVYAARQLRVLDGKARCVMPCFLVRVSELLREHATLYVTVSWHALVLVDRRSPHFFWFLCWFFLGREAAAECLHAVLCSNQWRSPVSASWHHVCPPAHAQSLRERIRLLRSRAPCPPANPLSHVPEFVFPAFLLLSRVGVLGMPSGMEGMLAPRMKSRGGFVDGQAV